MKRTTFLLAAIFLLPAAAGICNAGRNEILKGYEGKMPKLWSENVPGVLTKIDTKDRLVALTLDACGGRRDRYDAELIEFLVKNNVRATLFISGWWAEKFPDKVKYLSTQEVFEIENHGFRHKPASVNGRSEYGIRGTADIRSLIDEVEVNSDKLKSLTGRRPDFFRSGTAYYDEIAAEIIGKLGYKIAGFSVIGDAGATLNRDQVCERILSATPGSIIICHMNKPDSETAEGLIEAIPVLIKRGYRFVKLGEVELR